MADTTAGRTALVTGGTGVLGSAVVRNFVAAGHAVHVTWIAEREMERFGAQHPDLTDRVTLHRTDVTSPDDVARLVEAVSRADGPATILANIVGGFVYAPVEETTAETWSDMVAMNATSAFLCARAVIPGMRQAAWGRIVNVAGAPALGRGAANMSAYAASKAAVLNLTYSLSHELAGAGVTVNAIVPSIIDTPANRKAMPDADRSTWLSPDEIAEVVTYLGCDAAAIVTGTAVNLSRG